MIEIKPLKAKDIHRLLENNIKESGIKAYADDHIRNLAKLREDEGKAVTGWSDGEIVGCGGIDILWRGVGQAWVMVPLKVKCPKSLYICIKRGLEKLIKENDLWRVQAYARVGFPEAHKTLRHLGFKEEGLAQKYTPDQTDCILYSIVR